MTPTDPEDAPILRVALGEYDIGWHDPAGSLERASRLIAGAAARGAELVVLPEMCTTGFTMESALHAEPLTGPSVTRLSGLAREHGVHLVAGVATCAQRDVPGSGGAGACHNSALLIAPDGAIRGEYRKQRLYAYAGEDAAYAPGTAPTLVDISGVRIGLFICYDLRFPELFRAVGPEVDAMVLIASWPVARRAHWDVLVRARAIENQCYFVAVNRTGEGGGLRYDGGSVIYGPLGERLAACEPAAPDTAAPPVAEIRANEVTRVRTTLPFTEDRRGR